MPKKRHEPEEIVAKLRQVGVLVSQGRPVAAAIRSIAVSELTYDRWRKEFGGLTSDQVKRLKDLETENARLGRAVADLTLDKLVLKEAASGHWRVPRGATAPSAPVRQLIKSTAAPHPKFQQHFKFACAKLPASPGLKVQRHARTDRAREEARCV